MSLDTPLTEEQIRTLVDTLRWYADRRNYKRKRIKEPKNKYGGGAIYSSPPIQYDKGTRANFVLTTLELS